MGWGRKGPLGPYTQMESVGPGHCCHVQGGSHPSSGVPSQGRFGHPKPPAPSVCCGSAGGCPGGCCRGRDRTFQAGPAGLWAPAPTYGFEILRFPGRGNDLPLLHCPHFGEASCDHPLHLAPYPACLLLALLIGYLTPARQGHLHEGRAPPQSLLCPWCLGPGPRLSAW